MRRCEDEKMFYRPPLLEEPCAQTLSGKTTKKIVSKTNIVQDFLMMYFVIFFNSAVSNPP